MSTMTESCLLWKVWRNQKKGGKPASQIDGLDLIDESYTLRLNNVQYEKYTNQKKKETKPAEQILMV